MIKLRTRSGTAPYTYQILSTGNSVLETIVSNDQEVTMTVNPSDFNWKIADSTGKIKTGKVVASVKNIMQTYYKGHSLPHGNKSGHLTGINDAFTNGWNLLSLSFAVSNAMPTNAAWNDAAWDTTFDSSSGTPYLYYDEVVKLAREKGIYLKVNFQYTLPLAKLIGQSEGLTFTYSESDYMLRSDGTPVTKLQEGAVIPFDTNASIASTQYNIYKNQATVKFCTRYKDDIIADRINVFPLLAKSAESHYEHELSDNNEGEGITNGDYHVNMINNFRSYSQTRWSTIASFNSYNGTSFTNFSQIDRSSIGADTNYSSKFRQSWYSFLNEELIKHLHNLFSYIVTQIPELNIRFLGLDLGDIADSLGRGRGSYSIDDLCKHPNLLWIKSNPNPYYTKEFSINQLASLAENYSLKAMVEPTAYGPVVGQDPVTDDEWAVIAMINYAKVRNVSMSFIDQESQLSNVKAQTGIIAYNTVSNRNVLNGSGKIVPFVYTLSQILQQGGVYGNQIQTDYLAHDSGATDKVITIVNDLK